MITNLDKLSNYINKIWKKYINRFQYSTDDHIFIMDMKRVEDSQKSHYQNIRENTTDTIPNYNFNIDNYFVRHGCEFIPNKILPKSTVQNIFDNLVKYDKVPDWNKLETQLKDFSNYLLYSNIDLDAYKKKLRNKDSDTINVLILGAGPTGLYIANYINNVGFISPKINLLILDNKIIRTKKGLRLPYTRTRIYGINFNIFSSFFPKFTCLKELLKKGGVNIKYLENLLIIFVYGNKIPIYFTNEVINQDMLKKFVSENKIDVVFDCTGGRLKNDFITDSDSNFFPKNVDLETEKYKIIIKDNEARLTWKDNINYRYYLTIEIYDDDGKLVSTAIQSYNIFFPEDLELLSKFHKKCFKAKKDKLFEINDIFSNMKDRRLSTIIKKTLLRYKKYSFKFLLIESKIYHKLKISEVIKQKSQDTLYIGAGDTIFSSHFTIGAGLNRLLHITNHIIWSLQMLDKE